MSAKEFIQKRVTQFISQMDEKINNLGKNQEQLKSDIALVHCANQVSSLSLASIW